MSDQPLVADSRKSHASALLYLAGLIATSVAILAAGWTTLPGLLEHEKLVAADSTLNVMNWMAWTILTATASAGLLQIRRMLGAPANVVSWALMLAPLVPGFCAVLAMLEFRF